MNNQQITTAALAATWMLLSQGAWAQSTEGFQITLDRSGVSQILSEADFYSASGFLTTQAEFSRIDQGPTIVSRQILEDNRYSEPYADTDGNLFIIQKSLVKTQTVTDVTLGTTFSGDAQWIDWDHQYVYEQSPAGTVTGVSITTNPALTVGYYLSVTLAGHTPGTFTGELPPVSLVLPEGSAIAPAGEIWFDDVGNWSYTLTLHSENFPELPSTLAFNAQPGAYIFSVSAGLNGWSAPTLQYQTTLTESYTSFDPVPWNPAPVPEPSTWALAALGLGWLVSRAPKARALAA